MRDREPPARRPRVQPRARLGTARGPDLGGPDRERGRQQAARRVAEPSGERRRLRWGCVAARTGGDTCRRPKVTLGSARAPPAPSSSCWGMPDPPRGLVRHFSRAARHLPQPWRGFRCGCNSRRVSKLRSVRPGGPLASRSPAGGWVRGPRAGGEGSGAEGERPPSRSAKSTAGAEEPPEPGPAHRSSADRAWSAAGTASAA